MRKKSKRKAINKVKKNPLWLTLLFCFVIALIVDVFIAFFASSFTTYIIESKIVGEYESVSYLAKLYDKNTDENEDIFSALNEEGRDYYIADKHGKIIYQNGNNTMGNTSGYLELPSMADKKGDHGDVRAYLDNSTEGFLTTDDEGKITFDPESMLAFAYKVERDLHADTQGKQASIDLPIWIAIDVKDGKQVFYGKASFVFSMSDIVLLSAFILVGIALVGCILILMLVNMITTFTSQKRMTKYFFTDPITRGHNWMWFTYKGEKILRKRKFASQTFAILDLVFLKYRNYCVCHSVAEGEEMLCKIDRLIKENLGKNEFSAHYASANFALALKANSPEELEARVKGLLEKLEALESDHRVTFHVGAYLLQPVKDAKGRITKRRDIDIEREYNNACTARATLDGCDDSGIAFFDADLVEEQKWIDIVLDKYEAAIENEEFVVYYQPKYDPKTSELKGVEALIRWNSPELGFKAPSTFIPILEKNGLIPKIDKYMISHVARDQKSWLDMGLACVPASVNVSRAHFMEKDLANQIKNMVDKEGCPHEYIEIELTESAFFDDKKAMIDTIEQLKDMGFKVSMDDFGSGYSSLNSLKDMPLDILKLDAEFFRGDLNDDRGEIVVSQALKLAKDLNMLTVAEGVEEKEQVDFLAKYGCDMIQGFYFAKPMPKEEYTKRMDDLSTPENEAIAQPNPEALRKAEERRLAAEKAAAEKAAAENEAENPE